MYMYAYFHLALNGLQIHKKLYTYSYLPASLQNEGPDETVL